jgi:hypothetical protein
MSRQHISSKSISAGHHNIQHIRDQGGSSSGSGFFQICAKLLTQLRRPLCPERYGWWQNRWHCLSYLPDKKWPYCLEVNSRALISDNAGRPFTQHPTSIGLPFRLIILGLGRNFSIWINPKRLWVIGSPTEY